MVLEPLPVQQLLSFLSFILEHLPGPQDAPPTTVPFGNTELISLSVCSQLTSLQSLALSAGHLSTPTALLSEEASAKRLNMIPSVSSQFSSQDRDYGRSVATSITQFPNKKEHLWPCPWTPSNAHCHQGWINPKLQNYSIGLNWSSLEWMWPQYTKS